ncbi:MAG TPA: hypothetical protein VOB72_09655 [Candidatus Dormibacteraeota bacterium]|nr:hypothetical protein [Candidatus Dormibacteraeota bacterium]
MSRALIVLALLACLGATACGQPSGPAATGASSSPSILAQPPPAVRLRAAGDAILSDQAVGSARRGGHDHLTAEQAASEQPDQGAAMTEYAGWGWLDGASRTWTTADETLVITARPDEAARALDFWAKDAAQSRCPPAAMAGLDDCRLGVSGDRAVVVGRLASAVFRLQCPASAAERLAADQAAALHP